MNKIALQTFREKAEPSALSNINVFYGLDMAKVNEIGLRGSKAQKDAVRRFVDHHSGEIDNRIMHLIRSGSTIEEKREADRLADKLREIQNSPNYI